MKQKSKALFILLGSVSLISLSSCGCFNMFNSRIKFNINSNIKNGTVEILNYLRDGDETYAGDIIKVNAIGDKGYKLDQLLINDEDITLTPRIKVGKVNEYNIDAKFVPLDIEPYSGSFSNNKTTYETINSTQSAGTIPPYGNPNILVVPVEFKDVEPFSSGELANLDKCFNGTKEDGSNDYWESVSSFYKKSSYGKLNLNFDITDTYTPTFTTKDFINLEKNDTADGNYKILADLYSKLTIDGKKVDYKDYDSNHDGYVDGVWLIHNYKDKNGVFNENNFWAYCHVYTKSIPSKEKPTFSRYANCSQAFLYQGKKGSSQYGADAHTLIHETGHMFGLDDYYSYDTKREGRNEYQIIGSVGGIDMMDLNIGDHNAFSKFSLGWVNPYKVNKDVDIKLRPFEETGDCLVIPVYPKMSSAFNEYILVEYYTPTNLNKLDAENSYLFRYPNLYKKPGVKIWHIDAKLIDRHLKDASDVCDELIYGPDLLPFQFRKVGLSNTASFNPYQYQKDGRHNLIEAITPDNIRTYDNNYLGVRRGNQAIRGLFIEGDCFNYKSSFNFFTEQNYLHDKSFPFNWSIRVENLDETGATISIKNIANN